MTETKSDNDFNTAENPKPEAGRMNFMQRVTGIITSPSAVMNDLIERPRILFPVIAQISAVLLFYLARYDLYVDFMRSNMETALQQQGAEMTQQQLDAAMKIAPTVSLATTPIMSLFWWIAITAVIFGLAKIFRAKGKFKQYLSITGYAYVITILFYLLSALVSFFNGKLMLDDSLANITNLFAPGIKGSYLYGVIRGIGLFNVWYYSIIGMGIAAVSGLKKGRAYLIVFLVFAAFILISANGLKML